MTTSFDTDPNTQTVASAWASSPLGRPDDEVGHGFAPAPVADADDAATRRRPAARHAVIAAALAIGIGGGAALGLMLFDFSPNQSTVTVPSTAPDHAVVITDNPAPNSVQPAPSAVVTPAPVTGRVSTPAVAPQPEAAPVPEQTGNPQVPAPESQEDPQVPTPAPPEEPQDPDPNPQEPPVVVDDFTLPEPQPEPDPQPPVVVDDFKLPDPPQPEPDPGPIFSPPIKAGP